MWYSRNATIKIFIISRSGPEFQNISRALSEAMQTFISLTVHQAPISSISSQTSCGHCLCLASVKREEAVNWSHEISPAALYCVFSGNSFQGYFVHVWLFHHELKILKSWSQIVSKLSGGAGWGMCLWLPLLTLSIPIHNYSLSPIHSVPLPPQSSIPMRDHDALHLCQPVSPWLIWPDPLDSHIATAPPAY